MCIQRTGHEKTSEGPQWLSLGSIKLRQLHSNRGHAFMSEQGGKETMEPEETTGENHCSYIPQPCLIFYPESLAASTHTGYCVITMSQQAIPL